MIIITIVLVWLLTIISMAIGFVVALYLQAPKTLDKVMDHLPKRKKAIIIRKPNAEIIDKDDLTERGEEEFSKILHRVGVKPNDNE